MAPPQLLPAPRPRLHHCHWPIIHTLLAISAACGWVWGSWQLCFHIGAWIRFLFLPQEVHPVAFVPFVTFAVVWLGSLLVDIAWLCMGIPLGAVIAYMGVMGRCTRPLEMLARDVATPGKNAEDTQLPPHPIMVERVYLNNDEARRRGMPGPVIVERIHYPDPRDH